MPNYKAGKIIYLLQIVISGFERSAKLEFRKLLLK